MGLLTQTITAITEVGDMNNKMLTSVKDLDEVCCDCTSVLKTQDLSVVNVSCKNCPVSMLKLIAKYYMNPEEL
jgi:hypothetical protein